MKLEGLHWGGNSGSGEILDLSGIRIANANLTSGLVERVRFRGASLTNVDFSAAGLTDVDFYSAGLTNVDFTEAGLTDVDFYSAGLTNVYFIEAGLADVNFRATGLTHVDFYAARLTGVYMQPDWAEDVRFTSVKFELAVVRLSEMSLGSFSGASIGEKVVFETFITRKPLLASFATAGNLADLTFESSEAGLITLRAGFDELGMQQQKREINFAINRERNRRHWQDGQYGDWLLYWVVEFFTGYGLYSGRPATLMGLMTLLGTLVYARVIFRQSAGGLSLDEPGIWLVKAEDSIRENELFQKDKPVAVCELFDRTVGTRKSKIRRGLIGWGHALYYSAMVTFRIGWKDLSIGNWITRVDPRGVTLRSTGWVRAFSGVQSLVGVFLFAMWVWAYFSLPLE